MSYYLVAILFWASTIISFAIPAWLLYEIFVNQAFSNSRFEKRVIPLVSLTNICAHAYWLFDPFWAIRMVFAFSLGYVSMSAYDLYMEKIGNEFDKWYHLIIPALIVVNAFVRLSMS